MSIFFDFEVGPSGRRFRNAVDGDKDDIKLLLDSSHSKLFGDVDIGGLIELSTLSICMINVRFEVTGFIAFCDYPNVSGVDPAHWEIWIRNLFQKFFLARNTLFIHFMCCAKDVEEFFMEEALVSVFQNDAYLLHIVLMVPPSCPEDCYLKYQTFRKRNFYKYCAQKYEDFDYEYCFYAALRQEFFPKLKVRRAVEEDNDDIAAILDKKSPGLKDLYGEFYISEIIGRHPEMKRKIIVAEYQTVAVGVMCINTDIDYETLQKTYELGPYRGLMKTTAFEKEQIKRSNILLRIFGEPIMLGKWSPFQQISTYKSVPVEDEPSKEKLVDIKPTKSLSRVNFERDAAERANFKFHIKEHSWEEYSDKEFLDFSPAQSKSNHNVVDLLDEDPFDYEIVNIDTNLLTVPKAISCDNLWYTQDFGPTHSRISNIQRNLKRRVSGYKNTPLLDNSRVLYNGTPDAFVIELFSLREDIDESTSFSAWYMNKKLTSVPRVNIDTRIVIIGGSRTAMGFINKLLFSDTSSYLFFTNVTLISRHGIPSTQRYSMNAVGTMFLKGDSTSERYLKSIPYTYYINVIKGTIIDFNKKEKYVKLANDSKCYYDKLFLLLGKQYQRPGYLNAAIERERAIRLGTFQYTRLDSPSHYEEFVYSNDTPDNVFIINGIPGANKALKYVKNLLSETDNYKIIVYGASIHAYCCLAALLEMKVQGNNIVFVEPFPPRNPAKTRVSLFCNDYVDNTIKKVLNSLKINVYRAFYFNSWTVDYLNMATHIQFLSYFKWLRLECDAFFYYGKRSVDEQAFIALNKSGMAYDGGIVVDHEFKTQDPCIYAAGPATRYSRRYYAEDKQHKYYDSYEVGEKLGSQIRNELDPLFNENRETVRKQSVRFSFNENIPDYLSADTPVSSSNDMEESKNKKPSNDAWCKLPKFKKPRVTHCKLPGGLYYLEVRPPASKLPHHYVQSLQYNGYIMETYKFGYFKLHLSTEFIVNGITCLTTEQYNLENFINLYGLSAVVLNNVHLRYTAKKLDNFFEFFRAPWAMFLYHDQKDELFAMVKELLPKGQHQGDTLRDGLRSVARKLSKTDAVTANTKLRIRSNFEKSPHIEAITDYVIQWLSENDAVLPMYLQPSDKGSYGHDVTRNPAFRKRKMKLTKLLAAIY